jgi:hypothetical protein
VRWRDRLIGIALGLLLGVAVVVAFVFVFSERTVDAPSLSGRSPTGGNHRPAERRSREPRPATVRIIGGAPPEAGPPLLRYRRGETMRLTIVSDASVEVQLTGYGLTRTIPAGKPTEIHTRASHTGSFALIVADSHISVAQIAVTRR